MAGWSPDRPQDLGASALMQATRLGTIQEGRESGEQLSVQEEAFSVAITVSAYPVRIEFVFDQIIPLHFPAINGIPHTDSQD